MSPGVYYRNHDSQLAMCLRFTDPITESNHGGCILTTYTTYVHTVASRILALVVILLRLSTPGISSHRSCTCPSQQLPLALSDPGGFLLLTRYHGMDNGVVHE